MSFEYHVRSSAQWEERTNQRAADFTNYLKGEYKKFVPQKGENHIRILPPSWKHAPHYGLDTYAHFDIGPDRGSVICLEHGAPQIGRKGEFCPICDQRNQMIRNGEDPVGEDVRRLRSVKRVVTFVLNRRDEDQGPLLWGMPYTCDRDISQISKDRDNNTYYQIDDPKMGYDLYFKKEGEQLLTKYFAWELAKKPTPVAQRYVDWIEQHPIPDCLRWRSSEEVAKIYNGGGARDEGDGSAEDEPPRSHHGQRGFVEEDDGPRGRREEEEEASPREEPRERRARPRSAANGQEPRRDDPPTPSSKGDERADEVRARFKKRRE